MSSIHVYIQRFQLSYYISSICTGYNFSAKSYFWYNLKRMLSCWENYPCAENNFGLGIESWVTTLFKNWVVVRKSVIYCAKILRGVICINVFLKLKKLWTFLHTFQKVLKEHNTKYFLNTHSEPTWGTSQWGALEKDKQSPYPIWKGHLRHTWENDQQYHSSDGLDFKTPYRIHTMPWTQTRFESIYAVSTWRLPSSTYFSGFPLSELTIPASSHPHRCVHHHPTPSHIACSAYLLTVGLYNLSGSDTPVTYILTYSMSIILHPSPHNIRSHEKKILFHIKFLILLFLFTHL